MYLYYMRFLLMSIITCVFINNISAQLTNIPDPYFENALINNNLDIGPIDGFVPTVNISNVSVLNISNYNISDLTGMKTLQASLCCIVITTI